MEDIDHQSNELSSFKIDDHEGKSNHFIMNGDLDNQFNKSAPENNNDSHINEMKSTTENGQDNMSDDNIANYNISNKTADQNNEFYESQDIIQEKDEPIIPPTANIEDDQPPAGDQKFMNKLDNLPVIIVEEQSNTGICDNGLANTSPYNGNTTGDGSHSTCVEHHDISDNNNNQEPSVDERLNHFDNDDNTLSNNNTTSFKQTDSPNLRGDTDNQNTSHNINVNDVGAITPGNCDNSEPSSHDDNDPHTQSPVTTINPATDYPSHDHLKTRICNSEHDGSNNARLEGSNPPRTQGTNDNEPVATDSLFVSQELEKESSGVVEEVDRKSDYTNGINYSDQRPNSAVRGDFVDCDSSEEIYDPIQEAEKSNDYSVSNSCEKEKENKGEALANNVSGDSVGEKENFGEEFATFDKAKPEENSGDDLVEIKTDEIQSEQSERCEEEGIKTTPLLSDSDRDNNVIVPLDGDCENKEKSDVDENIIIKEEVTILNSSSNSLEPEANRQESQDVHVSEDHQNCEDTGDKSEKTGGYLFEEQSPSGVKNEQDVSDTNSVAVEEDPIDRDEVTAFINRITEKAFISISQDISQVEDKQEHENKEDDTGETPDTKLNRDDNIEEISDKEEVNSEHIENYPDLLTEHKEQEPSRIDIDRESIDLEKDSQGNTDRELSRGVSPVIFSSGAPHQVTELQQPLEEDPFADIYNRELHSRLGDPDNFESEEHHDQSIKIESDLSSISSIENMSDESNCRPRSRPKSSHPRKRGQQDTTDQAGEFQGRFSPSQRQPKFHKNEQNERTASPTKSLDSTGDMDFDQSHIKIDENGENIPPFNDSALFQPDDNEKTMDNDIFATSSAEKHAPENGWGDAASFNNSSNGHLTPGNRNKVESSRLSLVSGTDRISRISDAADSLADMQNNLQDMFREAKGILSDYQSQLKDQPIAEFSEDVPEFTRAFSSLSDAYRACENVTGGINEQLQGIRTMTNEICDLITYKANSQGLTDFMQDDQDCSEKELTREQKEAIRKEQQARLHEIKAITARAAAQAQTAYELAAQAEEEATQAEVAATNARQEAEVAMKRIEEAKIAAEKRRIEEVNESLQEERKRIAEENARKKAEEERRQKEEEERRIAFEAQKKGTSLEEERRKAKEEKARLEAERKNPNNWPRYIYSSDGGDWNPGVGVILRAQQGCLDRDELQLTLVDQMDSRLPLFENEELISNIICLTPVDPDKVYKFEEPMSISIPHSCPRFVSGREPVVKLLTSDGKISTLNTHDLMFDDIKELKFVEVRLKQFGTMAVFLRPKKEQLVLYRMGGTVMSGVDSRVTITSSENAFRTNVTFTMEVQPIDQNLVTELKAKKPQDCSDLISTSPLVSVHMTSQFHKPLTLTLPCPQNHAHRPRRPQTAGNRLTPSKKEKLEPSERPLSARPFPGKDDTEVVPDEVHLLRKDGDGSWFKVEDAVLTQAKKKDVVTFDMSQPFNKLVLIRTKAGLSNAHVERILGHVIIALIFKPVSVIMRQKTADPNCVTVTCTQSTNVDKVITALKEEGYDHGPKPSPDIHLTEGQRLGLRFRGNLILMDEFSRSNFLFYNHLPFRLNFTVTEHDKYAQKGFDSYRGFSQIFTRGKVRKPSMAVDDRDRMTGQKIKDEYVDGDVLLCEHLIIIPKPDPETPRPLNIAPVKLSSEGVVNDELLRFLSTHLQNNDWKKVAALLNVKRSRIQAILRQNINNSTPQTVYDVLVSWSKRLPRAVNRTDILCNTLSTVGRDDLAEELRVRDEEFRQAKTASSRESYLRKAFIAIVRNPLAVTQWKHLARFLEVDDDEIQHIESTNNSCQESCMASLMRWKETKGQEATIPLLANKLRRCRYRRLAREIEDIR